MMKKSRIPNLEIYQNFFLYTPAPPPVNIDIIYKKN